MRVPSLVILTAIKLEADAVAAGLGIRAPSGTLARLRVGGLSIRLAVVGIGARRLPAIDTDRPRVVMMAGLAGALEPSLQIGQIIVDSDDQLLPISQLRRGRIHATDRIVATPHEKAELYRKTGALAVEMEGAIARKWAQELGASFIGIRSISDRADQPLDPAVLALVDEWGRPRWGRVLGMLLRRPWLLPQLIRLARNSRRAARTLGAAVRALVDHLAKQGATAV